MIAKDSFIILQSGTELTGALCRVGLKSRDVSYLHHVTCADLLSTLPEETRRNYLKKLTVSIEFWRTKGGCLGENTIKKLQDAGIPIEVMNHTNYKTNKKPVRMDYLDDIDITEFREIPTYKRMCICILKNDHACKYMGFALTKEEIYKRDKIMEQFKNMML